MNISLQNMNSMTAPGLRAANGMKSTQQKMERQEKCANQVAFLENQKENLKNVHCDSLEDITHKLEMFHSYEDQIAAAKKEFNNSQMMHALDEARERGEKIAEAAEKTEPKTAEERKKQMQEEALGQDDEKGMLTEIMEEVSETLDEIDQEAMDEILDETDGFTEQDLQAVEETAEDTEWDLQAVEQQRIKENAEAAEEQQMQQEKLRLQNDVYTQISRIEEAVYTQMQQYKHFDQSI